MELYLEDFLNLLQELVLIETPTYGGLINMDNCADHIQNIFTNLGCNVRRIKNEDAGDHLLIYSPYKGHDKVLVIGHYDTVYPIGTIKKMPFKIENEKVWGPGVVDMKGGIVQIFFALKILFELNLIPRKEVAILLTSDEEGGSTTSKELVKAEAQKSKYTLVLEPGFPDINAIKTSRYARGVYQIEAFGVASHAGNCPEKGVNAIDELISIKNKIDKWDNINNGSTCTVIQLNGGNAGASVVPDYATMKVDVRAKDNSLAEMIDSELHALKPVSNGAEILVTGGIEKPALEFDSKNESLFHIAKEIAELFDISLIGKAVRGGSDGNFSFSAGSATLDGLGMTGDNLHNPEEYILLHSITKRTAYLAGLLLYL